MYSRIKRKWFGHIDIFTILESAKISNWSIGDASISYQVNRATDRLVNGDLATELPDQ
jgi:hypothetical protein